MPVDGVEDDHAAGRSERTRQSKNRDPRESARLTRRRRSMLTLTLGTPSRRPLNLLCLGAHCDDIEIGCGAALLRLAGERAIDVTWVVLCSTPMRAREVRTSAAQFLRHARSRRLLIEGFRDGFLPATWGEAKEQFERLKDLPSPDIVFTHERDDRHQDHRLVNELTWNTFRDHLILEYEIPKYDGRGGQPNFYIPAAASIARRKSRLLCSAYKSQRSKAWFREETFQGLMRLRGIECNAEQGYAEAFYSRKTCI
jgi:LmbE family N-acetylglucosaminyl deacetylase